MAEDAAKVASAYFDAWKANDFDTMRSLVDDDITFVGPLAQLEGAQDYMEGIKGMSRITSDIVIRKTFVDGPDVLTWYELHTTVASPVAVATGSTSRTARSRPYGWHLTLANWLPRVTPRTGDVRTSENFPSIHLVE